MIRAGFENELKQLHAEIINMGMLVESAIKDSVNAFNNSDFALCKEIIDKDNDIDEMEKRIESKCLWLIAREQPIAGDLRNITTALKIASDMERIGDHASDIAEITLQFAKRNSMSDSPTHIPEMADAAIKMVNKSVTAYVNCDLELARATRKKDDKVDDYFNLIKQELIDVFNNKTQNIDNAIDLLLIAKYLERIADHAVNICEWVTFSQTGEHKHTQIF